MKKILLSGLVLSSLLIAEDINFDEGNKLTTHTEFGYISTEGNTQTKTYALESKIKKGFKKNLFSLNFDGQYAEAEKVETKNKYFVELAYDYEITAKIAFNYLVAYKDDKFSGYSYQVYTGPGVVYKAIEMEKHTLTMDGNILYSQDEFDDVNDVQIESEDYTSFRAQASYEWQILEDLKFNQDINYRAGFEDTENYFVFSKTALSSKVSDMLSAGISYKIDYVNLEAIGKESTDKTLTATLTIDY